MSPSSAQPARELMHFILNEYKQLLHTYELKLRDIWTDLEGALDCIAEPLDCAAK